MIGKPLPLVPPIEGLPRSAFYNPAPSIEPRTPAKASNLIKFFESAGGSPSAPGPSTGLGHVRGASVPEVQQQGGLLQSRPVVPTYPGSGHLAPRPVLEASLAAELPVAVTEPGVLSNMRKGSSSPLRSVRNVVAAWRGRVLPHSRSGPTDQLQSGGAPPTPNPELIAGQADDDDRIVRDKHMFDDAFVTIRRKSTRRRQAGTDSPAPPYPTSSRDMGIEKPLPLIRDMADEPPRKPRGQVVSTYTEMTSEVSQYRAECFLHTTAADWLCLLARS
jgi:hypothetical protein